MVEDIELQSKTEHGNFLSSTPIVFFISGIGQVFGKR